MILSFSSSPAGCWSAIPATALWSVRSVGWSVTKTRGLVWGDTCTLGFTTSQQPDTRFLWQYHKISTTSPVSAVQTPLLGLLSVSLRSGFVSGRQRAFPGHLVRIPGPGIVYVMHTLAAVRCTESEFHGTTSERRLADWAATTTVYVNRY